MAGKFEPKTPVILDPPNYDPISLEDLALANGAEGGKCYVAIKGVVYDVTGNKAYQPGGSYNAFAGKDASHALAKTSTKPEDVKPEWQHLDDKEKSTLNDWVTFFSKRYNIVGTVEGATNREEE
ncbi:cytochrome b5-like heme/steroid binding domain-containing protein [Lasiosphaeria ovina]|uniref:Cytochrome b5-like heme/steroid binding domain-containing protein n=1 Tax=Lasiosphaeria ovina TaxID=92902 RepID=A0AAE0KC07_9PEZI|nr:cytochrome b5-like heme/steroid binding domain-containing protein [Lasiosphaeria ovina]